MSISTCKRCGFETSPRILKCPRCGEPLAPDALNTGVANSEEGRRSRGKFLKWGYALLVVSLLLSLGPVIGLALLKQGRSGLAPVTDPNLIWTGTQAEFISISVQSAIGAICWGIASALFGRSLKFSSRDPAALAGITICIALLIYGLFTMDQQLTRLNKPL